MARAKEEGFDRIHLMVDGRDIPALNDAVYDEVQKIAPMLMAQLIPGIFGKTETYYYETSPNVRFHIPFDLAKQHKKAYADALATVRASNNNRENARLSLEVLALGVTLATPDFYERYLRDFKDHAPADAIVVAHAKLGGLYLRASCPLPAFHGGCVEFFQEARQCPNLENAGARPGPGFPPRRGNGRHYFVTLAKVHPRDPRLVALATSHLRAALEAKTRFGAEQAALPVVSRQRALANAKAQAIMDRAVGDLDRFLASGGVPEDLVFDVPTQFDSPCEAERKRRTFEYSQQIFQRWLHEKAEGYTRLLSTYREAIAIGGPESAVLATARFAYVVHLMGQVLGDSDTQRFDCPQYGFVERASFPFQDNAQRAAKACLRLANAYALESPATHYCRFLANQGPAREREAIPEIFPNPMFMALVRDPGDNLAFSIPRSTTPPKPKPTPPTPPCAKRHRRGSKLGVLTMYDGIDLAPIFSRTVPFAETFPAELVERFPVFGSK